MLEGTWVTSDHGLAVSALSLLNFGRVTHMGETDLYAFQLQLLAGLLPTAEHNF